MFYCPCHASGSFFISFRGGGSRDPDNRLSILSGDVTGNDTNVDGNFIAEAWNELVNPNCSTVIRAKSGHTLTATNVFDGLVITAGNAVGLQGSEDPTTQGAAVYLNHDGQPVFKNCLFSGNRGVDHGGAVFIELVSAALLQDPGPFFVNCDFAGNRCTYWGGAVAIIGGETVFEDCHFTGNDSRNGSAVHHRSGGGDMRFRRCEFLANANISGGTGGTIFADQGSYTEMENCLIAGNDGVGIVHMGGMKLYGITIAGNDGAPIAVSGTGSLFTWNSVFWNNTSDFSDTPGGQLPEFHHSLVESYSHTAPGFSNNGNLDGTDSSNDPDFVASASPGAAPFSSGNYRLNFNSPVMSVGDNDEVHSGPDLAGSPRISGHTVDLGCYEYQLPDSDNDGLSDAFELAHTTPPSATSLHPSSNLDGDPFTALQEFAFDLDPNIAEASDLAYYTEWNTALQRLDLYWTPNPDAFHYLRIIPEASNDLGITDPWFETAIKLGNSPGEFRASTQTIVPRPEMQYLRLRVEN